MSKFAVTDDCTVRASSLGNSSLYTKLDSSLYTKLELPRDHAQTLLLR
jgi:hypothetical protein